MPRTAPALRTERLIVRLAEIDDVPAIVQFFTENRAHLAPSRPTMDPPFFTEGFWRAQVFAARAEFDADRSVRLFLFDAAEPGVVAGSVNFTNMVRGGAQLCALGYGLARTYEGKGLMTEALRTAIRYVFDDLNFHRIQANYVPRNERSGRLLRRLGFMVEGYARDFIMLNGVWEDHILTSLVNPDWRER